MNKKELLLKIGGPYLHNNDIVGMYDAIYKEICDEGLQKYLIGDITKFLEEECEIDTVGALKSNIPPSYLQEVDYIPDSLRGPGWTLTFPDKIEFIGSSAFADNGDFTVVDLRNIAGVHEYAFNGTSIREVFLPDPDDIYIGEYVFDNTGLETVYLPKSTYKDSSMTDVEEWFYGEVYTEAEGINFRQY